MTNNNRQQPGTVIAGRKAGGEFAPTSRSQAVFEEYGKQGTIPEVTATIEYQEWDEWGDSYRVLETRELDLQALFDEVPLDELPDEVSEEEGDRIYYEAIHAGILRADHEGPFSLTIDEDTMTAYREARERTGQVSRVQPDSYTYERRAAKQQEQRRELERQMMDLQNQINAVSRAEMASSIRAVNPDARTVVAVFDSEYDTQSSDQSPYRLVAVQDKDGREILNLETDEGLLFDNDDKTGAFQWSERVENGEIVEGEFVADLDS